MKRILKIMLVLLALAMLGCDSSKGAVTLPGEKVPDGMLSVVFEVDESSFDDRHATNPRFTVSLKKDIPTEEAKGLAIGQTYSLDKDTVFVLTGSYRNTVGDTIPFPAVNINTYVFGNDIRKLTFVRDKNGWTKIIN